MGGAMGPEIDVEREQPWYRRPPIIAGLVLLAGLIVLLVVLLVADDEEVAGDVPAAETETEAPVVEVTETVTAAPSPEVFTSPTVPVPDFGTQVEVAPGPEPQQFSGVGFAVTEPFEHDGGLAVIRVHHPGGDSLSVAVVDANEQEVEQVVTDRVGEYEGSRAIGLEEGTYRLRITAEGEWAIRYAQPEYIAGPELPQQLSGAGDAATIPFEVSGEVVRFEWEEVQGSVRFRLLTTAGEVVFERDVTLQEPVFVTEAQAGLYLLDVVADGTWRVTVS